MDTHDLNMAIAQKLRDINADSGGVVAGLLSDDLSKEEQIAFAHRLVDVAELIRQRATALPVVVEGGVIDDSDSRENQPLSSGQPRTGGRRQLPPGDG